MAKQFHFVVFYDDEHQKWYIDAENAAWFWDGTVWDKSDEEWHNPDGTYESGMDTALYQELGERLRARASR